MALGANCTNRLTETDTPMPFLKSSPELSLQDAEEFEKGNDVVRGHGYVANGSLAELQETIRERKHLSAMARENLDKLVSDTKIARLEAMRRDEGATSSRHILEAHHKRATEVRRGRGVGGTGWDTIWFIVEVSKEVGDAFMKAIFPWKLFVVQKIEFPRKLP